MPSPSKSRKTNQLTPSSSKAACTDGKSGAAAEGKAGAATDGEAAADGKTGAPELRSLPEKLEAHREWLEC